MAKASFDRTNERLKYATCLIEEAAESGQVAMFGEVYREVLLARGELAAFGQLTALEETLARADTVRPGRSLRILR